MFLRRPKPTLLPIEYMLPSSCPCVRSSDGKGNPNSDLSGYDVVVLELGVRNSDLSSVADHYNDMITHGQTAGSQVKDGDVAADVALSERFLIEVSARLGLAQTADRQHNAANSTD